MKIEKYRTPVSIAGRTILFSLFCAAAGVYAVAADSSSAGNTTTGETETKNIWVGSYENKMKGSFTLSQDKDGLNIADVSQALDFVKSDVKYEKEAIKGSIKVAPSSVDLKMKAVSEDENATVFAAGDINLSKSETFQVSQVGKIDADKAKISAVEAANFKLEAEAVAENGEARAVKIGRIYGGESRVIAYDDSEGKGDTILDVKSEKGGDIEIKAIATGKTLANAIEATGIYGGNVVLEAVATATEGNANAIIVEEGIYSKNGESSIKASAEATNGNAVAIKATGIDANTIEASAVSKAQMLDQQDRSKLATVGDATAIDGATIHASTVKTSALSEGGNATALKSSVYSGNELTIEAAAEAKKAQISESADGKTKTFAAGNATAIENYNISVGGWKNDQQYPTDETLNDVNANIKASAIAEGFDTNTTVEATAIKGMVVVGNDETISTDVVKTLPEKLTKNVSATINASAVAGTAVDGKIATKGNTTAFNGDITVGSELTVDNAYIVPNEDAKKMTVKETLAPIQIESLVAADRLGKASLDGSFSAQAVGGDAIAIDAGKIEIGNRVFLKQYDYTTTEAQSGTEESAFNDDGTLKQKYAKDESEKDQSKQWKPRYIDADGNETFEKTDKIATVELKADKDGKYAMDTATERVFKKEVAGDFNADVSAVSLGGNAKGIKVADRLGANINGNVSAESKANVVFVKDADGKDTKEIDEANSSFANASAIYAGTAEVIGNINGNLSAKTEGGMATGMFAASLDGDINGTVSAENTALKSVKQHKDQEYVASVITNDVNGVSVAGDINGDINGTVSAKSEGGNVIGVKANAINGAINGKVSAESKAVLAYKVDTATDKLVIDEANSKFGTAIAVDPKTENLVINGTLSAVADSLTDTPSNAKGLVSTDGTVNFGNGAIVSAKQNVFNAETKEFEHVNMTWDDASKKVIKQAYNGNAIQTSGELVANVSGRADIKGNVNAGGEMTVNGGNLVVAGDLTGVSAINLASDANLAMTADAAGNVAKITIPVNYAKLAEIETAVDAMDDLSATQKAAKKAEMKNAYLASVRANKFAGNATMLVNDKTDLGKLADLNADQAFQKFDETNTASNMNKDDVNALGSLNGDSINFSYSVDNTADQNVTMKVNRLSYFQNKASNANSARLGAALDGITTIEASENETKDEALAREAAIQTRRDFKSDVETLGMAASGSNTSINLDGFLPTAQSFIAQLNNEALINMNTVQMFRLASRADVKRNNTKYAVDRAGANVAEFQSINMLGSQDGGANAAGFDFWSAGGVAAIERDFSKNLFAGLSLGGTYNKVDGDANADANSTNFIVNVYGEYSFDQIPLDLFLNLGYSHGWNETSRQTELGTAKADYDSNSFYSLGGVAYTFSDVATKGLSIKPMLMYNLAYSNADSVDEEGAGIYNASVEGNDFLNFRTMLGVEVKYDITSNFSALVRAFWTHEFADNSYDVDYRIAQAASYMPTAKFESEEVGRDAAVLGFGLQYKFDDAVSAFIDYSATLRSGYSAHGLNLGAQFRF